MSYSDYSCTLEGSWSNIIVYKEYQMAVSISVLVTQNIRTVTSNKILNIERWYSLGYNEQVFLFFIFRNDLLSAFFSLKTHTLIKCSKFYTMYIYYLVREYWWVPGRKVITEEVTIILLSYFHYVFPIVKIIQSLLQWAWKCVKNVKKGGVIPHGPHLTYRINISFKLIFFAFISLHTLDRIAYSAN